MITHDLCLAWNWEHDGDFAALLDGACRARELSLWQVTPGNLDEALRALVEQQVGFQAFLDRASEVDARFMPLVRWASEHGVYAINPTERASRTWDKAAMHRALVTAGLDVPRTLILPAHAEQPIPPPADLASLGGQFTIKPAHGSGGEGVWTHATSWEQVLSARQEHPGDRYLLQAHVVPRELDGRPAWFRVITGAGRVYPCWWNPHSHVYTPVNPEEKERHGLGPLDNNAVAIARLCGLDLFSTEIAFTPEGRFVVVDYVNDPIDLRLQSKTADGVPDDIVHGIAERLVGRVVLHRVR